MAIATAAEDVGMEVLMKQSRSLADNLDRSHHAASGLAGALDKGLSTIVHYGVLGKVIKEVVARSERFSAVQKAISVESLSHEYFMARGLSLRRQINFYTERQKSAIADTATAAADMLAKLQKQQVLYEAQKVLLSEMRKISVSTVTAVTVGYASFIDLLSKVRSFNQNLIEANSSFEKRNDLFEKTLQQQIQLGVGFDHATEAVRALVHYGMDTEQTFNRNVKTVLQLEHGIGLAVIESAKLASIVERQVGGSFEEVAATVARLVNDTALAGNEAARLAETISTAMSRLGPGIGAAGLPAVVQLIGRYESALKGVSGQSGGFQQLLTKLTTLEGQAAAGLLGVSPDFLSTSQGVQTVMDNFSKYAENFVGMCKGWERQARLSALGDIFGVSADQANQMIIAMRRVNEEQVGQISLQNRWREQMHSLNNGLGRITNQIVGLMQAGLLPLANALGAVTNWVADLVEGLASSELLISVVSKSLTVAIPFAALSLMGVARALVDVAKKAVIARLALISGSSGAAGGAAGGGSGSITSLVSSVIPSKTWLSNMLTWAEKSYTITFKNSSLSSSFLDRLRLSLASIPKTGAGLLGPVISIAKYASALVSVIGGLAVGIGALTYVGWKTHSEIKRLREETTQVQKLRLSQEQILESGRRARLANTARFGTPEDTLGIYKKLVADSATMFSDLDPRARLAAQRKWIGEQYESAVDTVSRARAAATLFTPTQELTPEQEKRDQEMKALYELMLKENQNQNANLVRQYRQSIENQAQADEDDFKNRTINPFSRNSYLGLGFNFD